MAHPQIGQAFKFAFVQRHSAAEGTVFTFRKQKTMEEITVNMNLAGTIVDAEAHQLSGVVDVAIDRLILAENPGTERYCRPATELERVAYGMGDSPTAITDVTEVVVHGQVAIHRLTWDPAQGKRPRTLV